MPPRSQTGAPTPGRPSPGAGGTLPDFSLGVEEEYQLIDPGTGALRSRAPEVLEADWAGTLQAEMQQTMVEVGTPVCGSAAEADAALRRLRTQAAAAASSRGLAIVAAGLHPEDAWPDQRRSPGERYARIADRLGRVARTDHIFGMHVHVGIPEGMDRLQLMTRLRDLLPLLVALTASSPRYAGEDTGFSSYRTVLAGRLPNSGPPPAMASEGEFRRFLASALRAGALPDEASLYWILRPHARYPTLEFRAGDVCPRVEDAAAVAALLRAAVARAAAADAPPAAPSGTADALLRLNHWQAARFGLDAVLVAPGRPGDAEPMRDAVRRWVREVAPHAEALGDAAALEGVERVLERGNGADRIRAAAARLEGDGAVARWLAAETLVGVGMDRRAGQRERAG